MFSYKIFFLDGEQEQEEGYHGRLCTPDWDVRRCCEPNCPAKNSNAQLRACPMRVSTMVFHMGNNYDV